MTMLRKLIDRLAYKLTGRVIATDANIHELVRHYTDDVFTYDLNFIDVSRVTDMSCLFEDVCRMHKVSGWDVSHVTDMHEMFARCACTYDISGWDVSHVRDMSGMFKYSMFNGDLSRWDVSSVTNMSLMFSGSVFNGYLSGWNVSHVALMDEMFSDAEFNHDISGWKLRPYVRAYYFGNRNMHEVCLPERLRFRLQTLAWGVEYNPETKRGEVYLVDIPADAVLTDVCGHAFKCSECTVSRTFTDSPVYPAGHRLKADLPEGRNERRKDELREIIWPADRAADRAADRWNDEIPGILCYYLQEDAQDEADAMTEYLDIFSGHMSENVRLS
jgi:hypothetical protein